MAFVRQYSNRFRAQWEDVGDPGFKFGRVFKGLRKVKLGRLARGALGFVPGVGPALGIAERVMGAARRFGVSPDLLHRLLRERGIDLGDPGARTGTRRGAAAGSPKSKQAGRAARRKTRPPKKGTGPGIGEIIKQHAGEALESTIQLAKKGAGGDIAGALQQILAGTPAAGEVPEAPMGGGRRREAHLAHRHVDAWMVKGSRQLNPSNPRALRHAVRRIERFEKMVKSVERAMPRLRRPHGSRGSSHRSGCRCVVCRKAA